MSDTSEDIGYNVENAEDTGGVELTGPGVVFVEDEGWDAMPEDDDTLEVYYSLRERIVNTGYVAYSDGNMYFFIDASRQWSLLMAKDSLARICKILGANNVSVSTSEAVEHYYPWLAKHAIVNVALPLQRSICVGTRRLEVSVEGDALIFSRSRRLVEVPLEADQRAPELCVMPVMATLLPAAWRWPGGAAVYNHIVPLFRDPRDFLTFAWHVGNCLVDPVQSPSCLMLAGPGGSGKSSILNTINTVLEGCVGVLPNGTFTSGAANVSEKVLKQLVSSRMVTCGDVNLDDSAMDVHALRTIVSGDYITLGPFRSLMRSSLTLATNGYLDPKADINLASDAVIRRVTVLHMDAAAQLLDFEQIPHSQEARGDFVCMCTYVRMTHKHKPVTPTTVLRSIMGIRYLGVEDLIEETDEPTLADYIEVLSIVQAATGIPSSDVGHKASLVSRDAVVQIGRRKFLKGLRPVRRHNAE